MYLTSETVQDHSVTLQYAGGWLLLLERGIGFTPHLALVTAVVALW